MMAMADSTLEPVRPRRIPWLVRLALFCIMVYAFLAAIEMMGDAIGMLGEDRAKTLFEGLANPFAGLAVGILATVLMQSSSATTSTVVAMVGSGTLPLAYAVPMVMGANVGTSITNTLVSLGHITQGRAFRRAFAGATVHDIFNLMVVAILFPLEIATGLLQHTAEWIVSILPLQTTGGSFHSPIKSAVQGIAKTIHTIAHDGCGLSGNWLAATLLVLSLGMIVAALVVINKNMRVLMADRIEFWLNRVLQRSMLLGLAIGILATVMVQSSSITTSLLVPLFAAGVLKLEAGFPIMLGANIGTTVTAMLAATVTGPTGLTIAVVHLLFNVIGTIIFLPVRPVRRIPIRISKQLAVLATQNRIWVLVYILGVFVVGPILGILLWKS